MRSIHTDLDTRAPGAQLYGMLVIMVCQEGAWWDAQHGRRQCALLQELFHDGFSW